MVCIKMLDKESLDDVLELEKICFPDDPWGRISFENEISNPLSIFFIAIDDEKEKVIGYSGVWLMYDVGDITNIAVHPDYRREGIGTRLLGLIVDICREKGMESVTLEVRESNIAAQRLYETKGFKVCGIRRRYYQGKENAIIMTLELGGKEGEDDENFSN